MRPRSAARPTLIEWDNDMPPFAQLLAEADRANQSAADALALEVRRAG